jgi:DNA replication ATP-dependent helicase Dna2
VPTNIDIPTHSTNQSYRQLRRLLQQAQGLTLVGATVHQTHKLLAAAGSPVQKFFDLIVVDEASQVDVAASTLALAGLASGGSVIVAGDPKQLPPIHKAEPPLGLEIMVGPLFSYLQERHGLTPCVLQINYRSSTAMVELAYAADYPRSLSAYSPDLQMEFVSLPPSSQNPSNLWPQTLFWTREWSSFLDPAQKALCFVYNEGRSSQSNQFEADAIAALVWLLAGRLGDQLINERIPPSGNIQTTNGRPYSMRDFWARGVGIVTPHRAQQALIINRLQSSGDYQFRR